MTIMMLARFFAIAAVAVTAVRAQVPSEYCFLPRPRLSFTHIFVLPRSYSGHCTVVRNCGSATSNDRLDSPPCLVAARLADAGLGIGFGGGTVCGPSSRADEPSCPAPSAMFVVVGYWAASKLVGFLVFRRHFNGTKLPRPRRNVVAYFLNLLVTTVCLPIVLIAGGPLLFDSEELDDPAQRLLWFFGPVMVASLYSWELVFRLDINPSLMAHHMCTITLAILIAISIYDMEKDAAADFKRIVEAFDQNDPAKAGEIRALNEERMFIMTQSFRVAIIVLLAAMSEQPSFVALLMHRSQHRHTNAAFAVAAIWSGVSKTVLFVWGMQVYNSIVLSTVVVNGYCDQIRWCEPWRVMCPALTTLLFLTQLWATYILHVLSRRPRDVNRRATMAILADTSRSEPSSIHGAHPKRFSLAPGCLQTQGVRNLELELEFDPLHLVENSIMRNMVPAPRSTADRIRDSMVSMTQMTGACPGFYDDSIGSDRAKEAEAQELEEAGTNVDPIPGLPIQSSVV